MAASLDQRSFRSALGRFATGVTIITARDGDGRPVGVTANSFNSVSLDPPLVLWSLDRGSSSLEAFQRADEFVIHVLGIDQADLSSRFATRGIDKFEGLDIGGEGAPLLEGCAARFLCRMHQQHIVGDHVLFIGEVTEHTTRDCAPLLYLQGAYREARRSDAPELAYDLEAARLGKGAILNLFSDAYVRILKHVHAEFAIFGLQQPASIVLIALAEGRTDLAEIEQVVLDRDFQFSTEVREAMIARGLIAVDGAEVRLLPQGRALYEQIVRALKYVEDRLVAQFTSGELSEARHFLGRIGDTPP